MLGRLVLAIARQRSMGGIIHVLLLVLGIASIGQAQIQAISPDADALEPRRSRGTRQVLSESLQYLRAADGAKGSAENLAHRLISVNENNKHANLDSYLKASLSSRRGHALEAIVAADLNEAYQEVGRAGTRVHLTALEKGDLRTRSGAHDPADIVTKGPRGRSIKIQCKAGARAALDAARDAKYGGMYIVTTQKARKRIFDQRDREQKKLNRRWKKAAPGPRREEFKTAAAKYRQETLELKKRIPATLPPRAINGRPLPKEGAIVRLAKSVVTRKWNQLFPDGQNLKAVASSAAAVTGAPALLPSLGKKGAGLLSSLQGIKAPDWLKPVGKAIPWMKSAGRAAIRGAGGALAFVSTVEIAQALRAGHGNSTYFALKGGALTAGLIAEAHVARAAGRFAAQHVRRVAGRLATRQMARASLMTLANGLAATPEPIGTKATALVIVAGVALDIAAEKVLDSRREARETVYARLSVEDRFQHRLTELQDRADVLRGRRTTPAIRSR